MPRLSFALVILAGLSHIAWAQEATAPAVPGKVLDIESKVLDIVGVTLGVEGALADLGAKVTEREIKIALSGDVLFDFDKDTLRSDADPTLKKVAQVLAEYSAAPVTIEGHTDNKGDDKYNQSLSERRAQSVKTWLVSNANADGARIQTRGWGETKPAAPNAKPDGADDPDGRQRNRRVDITVTTR